MSIIASISRRLTNGLSLSSRATRGEFWSLWAVHMGAPAFGLGMLALAESPLTGLRAFTFGLILSLITLPLTFTAAIRRFHDAGQFAKTGAALFLLCFLCLSLAAWLSLPSLRVDAHLAAVHADMAMDGAGPRENALYAYLSPGVALGTAAHNILGALIFYVAILPLVMIAGLSFALITPTLLRRSDPDENQWGAHPRGEIL
ncbi:DUF805 domain-containing protein [Thalassobius sp. I31.1]|uniref:DUF805 domain-containing protein n=1 Tax=Thalassobius sp. I31.1 TaxID=2109912 RepID=UPI001300A8CD|nr:DUF805 domain-containing protein [Thalassobius sp. I31.1]